MGNGNLSRSDTATWANITLRQVDHFGDTGVGAPDVGGARKRFSIEEARLIVIAGSLLRYGLPPRHLVEPIDWLRTYSKWPVVEGLPKNLPETEIELIAARLRLIPDMPLRVKTLAQRLHAFSVGRHATLASHDDINTIGADYEAALKSDNVNERSRAEGATKRAEKMLSEPAKWSLDEINQAEGALQFELACRGETELFFHLSTGEDSWKTFIDNKVSRVEGEANWLVIDIRTLFRQRGALIA